MSQRSGDAPHPTDNILALTPESVASLAVIGYALDLGMCKAVRRDGTTCGSWCDRRVADVCDWHIQHAVERKRAGRAEFASGCVSPPFPLPPFHTFSWLHLIELN